MTVSHLLIWAVCLLATAGVIVRPWRWPEAVWALGGSAVLLILGLISPSAGLTALGKGLDVYLFLIGMMLLSETAREQGVFDWVAGAVVRQAGGSSLRLFVMVYAEGVVITALMSNDATAVVLTPAVYTVARRARAQPLPLLFACALIANAASFVLPISNPANLVLYGGTPPPLGQWLRSFAAPSAAAIVITFVMLWWAERRQLTGRCAAEVDAAPLSVPGKAAVAGVGVMAAVLLLASAKGWALGLPTCLAGAGATLAVCALARRSPLRTARSISWSVLLLVAGLFVLVEALDRTGVIRLIADQLAAHAANPGRSAAVAGTALAVASNLMNNLPAGLIASSAISQAHPPREVVDGLLIGLDLGPNLSVTGSLATILWLQAIRREGQDVGFWRFLKVGAVTMIPALAAALGARLLLG